MHQIQAVSFMPNEENLTMLDTNDDTLIIPTAVVTKFLPDIPLEELENYFLDRIVKNENNIINIKLRCQGSDILSILDLQ